jgi:hypothetical protein
MKQKFEAAQSDEERATLIKQKLIARWRESEKEREKLSGELLLQMEEFHSLGINRNFSKLIETQLDDIKMRLKGEVTEKEETNYLQNVLEQLEKKLVIVSGAFLKAQVMQIRLNGHANSLG